MKPADEPPLRVMMRPGERLRLSDGHTLMAVLGSPFANWPYEEVTIAGLDKCERDFMQHSRREDGAPTPEQR